MVCTHLCCQLLAPACAKDVECLMCCCCQVGWQAGAEAVALATQALVITHLHTPTSTHKATPALQATLIKMPKNYKLQLHIVHCSA
jgi:hypothetical protein